MIHEVQNTWACEHSCCGLHDFTCSEGFLFVSSTPQFFLSIHPNLCRASIKVLSAWMRLIEPHFFLSTPLADRQQIPTLIKRGCRTSNKMQNYHPFVCFEAETGTWLNPHTELVLHPDAILKNKDKTKSLLFQHLFRFVLRTTPRVPNL